ncbi:zinc transport system permease protein [Loktanella ponticola]|uniref:High-affinity zinc uptake system membrane protein ZnuB n=1 Tax=Yoonia ponticola TaxID=1524255 RepID=A0A7W9BL60_9RHOB|nr:metal ABC transporter permease [Yoonia ponticola]MBB5722538.1 zinc transport system permease protein [Yoonia ponticola]
MLDDFVVRGVLAALGAVLATGVLGCFVVWRRMAYFGDAMAHAAVLGVALSLAFSLSIYVGVIITALCIALIFIQLTDAGQTADAALGVLAHTALALGLVIVSLLSGAKLSLSAYLFGSVLSVGITDLAVIWGGALVVLGVLWWQWSDLLTATLSPDLAYAAGIDPRRKELLLTVLLALVVAVAIKVVGALLITALLIIPASAARQFARTPEGMAVAAMIAGALAALLGTQGSLMFDTPTGPSIVVAAAGIFTVSIIAGRLRS